MSVHNFETLRAHVGHNLECVTYADMNVAIECVDCGMVLVDFDTDEEIEYYNKSESKILRREWDRHNNPKKTNK
jgi:transcription initiation factor TFIIIB Brf1 subunit/transcription initiation factor TFIIB